ncbi:hypothetical protein GLOIN_2v1869391, partial [Rhizophagus irregularis DAOM 181602=DAOM 197198]
MLALPYVIEYKWKIYATEPIIYLDVMITFKFTADWNVARYLYSTQSCIDKARPVKFGEHPNIDCFNEPTVIRVRVTKDYHIL